MNKEKVQNLSFMFKPESICLFGASRNPNKSGGLILPNIIRYRDEINNNGINGKNIDIYIIHPKAESINGIKCYKSLDEIESLGKRMQNSIDLAIIALPVQFVCEAVIDCVKKGIKGIIIESGNLGNTEEEIKSTQKKILDALNEAELEFGFRPRIMGPNSLGLFNNYNHFFTAIMDLTQYPRKTGDNFAIIAQTGLVVSGYLIDLFEKKDIPISYICAIGNKFDIDECDILEYIIEDKQTKAIGMYLEGIKDGRRFYDLCRYAIYEKQKVLILLKSGRSEVGARAMLSHTCSIAGNTMIQEGVCKQLGIIQVNDFNELFLAGKISTMNPLPQGNRIGLISISGAGCVLSADLAAENGLNIPDITSDMIEELKPIFPQWADISHPLDVWASIEQFGAGVTYNTSLEVFLKSGLFDSIIFCIIAGRRAILDYEYLLKLKEKFPNIPIVLQIFGGWNDLKKEISENLEQGLRTYIPVIEDLERGIKTIKNLFKLWKKLKKKHLLV